MMRLDSNSSTAAASGANGAPGAGAGQGSGAVVGDAPGGLMGDAAGPGGAAVGKDGAPGLAGAGADPSSPLSQSFSADFLGNQLGTYFSHLFDKSPTDSATQKYDNLSGGVSIHFN